METWRSIAGYEGLYEVSNLGRVRSLKFGKTKILKPGSAGKGYLFVNLYRDGIRKTALVHRLVAEVFIPNTLNLKTVNHIDEDKTNNDVLNLEWMTSKDNTVYSQARQVQMFGKSTGKLLATFQSIKEAAHKTGVQHGNIVNCCKGRYKSAGGYVWKYA